jgi:hypothetical protein
MMGERQLEHEHHSVRAKPGTKAQLCRGAERSAPSLFDSSDCNRLVSSRSERSLALVVFVVVEWHAVAHVMSPR